ncbi:MULTISPECIES: sensor protein KdpD [Dysgonomonas]|uniref:Sensor protein KdpD n=1 Tax=Dysgonomonas capnocytophagoides TaxID=45254 RepID=A0A4Y8L5Q9_9BACT|nr:MULTISPECIES: sensor protein KdpD [Dysgonomonas]MBS7120601.1 sensor protein KdpD [Dysgonomonas sp.]TFD97913.1 sensor protein KdpD [Dysgonomonas capnocytophagoides]
MNDDRKSAEYFLNLIKQSKRGKFKLYIGMIAGVGKTYRMLQEAHILLEGGVDIKIGYIETHNRRETVALLKGIPVIQRRKIFYKGKELDELDVQAVINLHPEAVIIDELAHSNIEGSKNEKRWQDVIEILEAGINVISAVNVQHIEGLNEEVKKITGIEVAERIPDRVVAMADEVVNIDLSADDLVNRLKDGKIYPSDKIQAALANFFKTEHILRLRELALKEVASHVLKKAERETLTSQPGLHKNFMACIGSNGKKANNIIRKTARLASYYTGEWYVLYVQTPKEEADKIALNSQRKLINSFKMAVELGGQVIQLKHKNIPEAIIEQAIKKDVSTVCIGMPYISRWRMLLYMATYKKILRELKKEGIDLIILS